MKWEYFVEQLHTRTGEGLATDETNMLLARMGGDGWEAVTVWVHTWGYGSKTYVLFKRPA